MQAFLNWFNATLGQHISPELSVLLVSMLPVIEERGGLILAKMLMIPLWRGAIFCIIGNIIPVPFVLLGIKKLMHWMRDHHLGGFVGWLEGRVEKNKDSIEKYGFWGLMLFVGIPLPGTGAWTGSMIAAVLDMDVKKASVAVFLGVLLAAVIMCIVSYGGLGLILG